MTQLQAVSNEAQQAFRFSPNRQERRQAEGNLKKLIQKGSPVDKLPAVALQLLQGMMQGYGNKLSEEHKQSLFEVCIQYSQILFGKATGRIVISLDAGLGKTLSIVALAAAITKLGYKSKSIMVAQSRIAELCLMNDALIKAGVAPESIGLVHSYQYDPKLPVVDGEPLNEYGEIKKGYAARVSNAKEDSSQFQFLLVSHSKVKGKREIVKHTQYKGQPRTLTIWDESFISTEATCVGLRDLKTAIVEFEGSMQYELQEVAPFITWLKQSHDLLANEEKSQKAGSKAKEIYLPPLSEIQATTYGGYAQYSRKDKRSEWRQMLRSLVAMAADPVRVSLAGGEAVLQFSDAVSKQLTNLVVLDASYKIRELVRIDPTLQEPDFFVHKHNLKSYEDCTLHRLDYFGSRIAAETPVRAAKVAKEVAIVIKGLPLNEAICLFTFKWQDNPKKKTHASIVKSALQEQGIDIDTTVTLKDGTIKPRFMWKTWGQETGSNNASHCHHIFLVGVLRQPANQFLAQLVGQSHDLLKDMPKAAVSEAEVTELSHLIYQASLRSRARVVSNGRALSANFYLVLDEPRVESYLLEIMRGLTIKEWIPSDPTLVKPKVMNQAAQRVIKAFQELTSGDLNEISVRDFKVRYELTGVPDQTFKAARDQALSMNQGWYQPQGSKSFKRVFPSVTQQHQIKITQH